MINIACTQRNGTSSLFYIVGDKMQAIGNTLHIAIMWQLDPKRLRAIIILDCFVIFRPQVFIKRPSHKRQKERVQDFLQELGPALLHIFTMWLLLLCNLKIQQ